MEDGNEMKEKGEERNKRRGERGKNERESRRQNRIEWCRAKHERNTTLALGHICCQGNTSHNSDN